MKEISWLGDTKEALSEFPQEVRKEIGHALHLEQQGKNHSSIKALKGFQYAVREIRSSFQKEAYRAVYVVNLGDVIYMLHVFRKKSKKGIATPKPDMDLIHRRLKQAVADEKEKEK